MCNFIQLPKMEIKFLSYFYMMIIKTIALAGLVSTWLLVFSLQIKPINPPPTSKPLNFLLSYLFNLEKIFFRTYLCSCNYAKSSDANNFLLFFNVSVVGLRIQTLHLQRVVRK